MTITHGKNVGANLGPQILRARSETEPVSPLLPPPERSPVCEYNGVTKEMGEEEGGRQGGGGGTG